GGVGFSSYVIAQLGGHPNLAMAITPPLNAVAILALLGLGGRERGTGDPEHGAGGADVAFPRAPGPWHNRRVRRIGLGFGLLLGFQFYISTEVLAGTFLAALCFLICLAVFAHRSLTVHAWM